MISGQNALIVDPCENDNALRLLRVNKVSKITVLLTHEHNDHISGVNWLREKNAEVTVVCSSQCANCLLSSRKNMSHYFAALLLLSAKGDNACKKDYSCSCVADKTFDIYKKIIWEHHMIELYETPGHSVGSICIKLDNKILFTGDSLVNGAQTITRFPGGSQKDFDNVTIPFLKKQDPNIIVCPGHGDIDTLVNMLAKAEVA